VTSPTLVTRPVLASIVQAVLVSKQKSCVLALYAKAVWDEPPTLQIGEQTVHVALASSPISFCEAMVAATNGDRPESELTVILTDVDPARLGLDVTARLIKGRVQIVDHLLSPQAILGYVAIDKKLANQRWLTIDLANLVTHEQIALPFRGRVLESDSAWRTWLTHRLAIEAEPAAANELLKALIDPSIAFKLRATGAEIKHALAERWNALGFPTATALSLIDRGQEEDLVPLGLVLDVINTQTSDEGFLQLQQTARIRLETVFGREAVTQEQELVWAKASAVVEQATSEIQQQTWRSRTGALLADLGVSDLAALSGLLVGGFDYQLCNSAELLSVLWMQASLDSRELQVASIAVEKLSAHGEASSQTRRISMLEVVVRLLQRRAFAVGQTRVIDPSLGLVAVARRFADDSSWVDQCRSILIEGATTPALMKLASEVLSEVDAQRVTENSAFATSFSEWSSNSPMVSDHVVPIEQVLDDVVAPLATQKRVLLLVLDGAAITAMAELLSQLGGIGWRLLGRGDEPSLLLNAAVLPSVTEFCRASLFAGALVQGVSSNEKKTFSAHTALKAASSKNPPVLFHKGDLAGPDGQALSSVVRSALDDQHQRVVGIVVNAIDDHLSGGSQVLTGWGLDDIRHLRDILDLARDSDRVVVITADHGHVLDGGRSTPRSTSAPERGDRWRGAYEPAGAGELDVQGPRVVGGGGHIVVPIDEQIRYGGKKHGYHGGLTPQEVLVPLAVFARPHVSLHGWNPVDSLEPEWWALGALPMVTIEPDPVIVVTASPGTASLPKRAKTKPVPATIELFEPPSPVVSPDVAVAFIAGSQDWVDALFASQIFADQREAAARQPISDERLRSLLRAIRKAGFSLTRDRLTLDVGGQPARLRGEITTLRRLLNVEGYEVFADDGTTLTLNVELLATQFSLDVATIRGKP
jgi:PglZ domain